MGGGTAPGHFLCPSGVEVDPHGNVYLAAPFASRIVKLSPTLGDLAAWTGFAAPMSQATDPRGNVYVAGNGNNYYLLATIM